LADTFQRRRDALQAAALPTLQAIDPAPADTRPKALTALRKRTLDVVAAAGLLVVFSPVWLLCGLLIKLTSRGPVIFRQERIGAGQKAFTVYKFRTMRADTSDEIHRDFVTRYILGSMSLDAGGSYKLPRDHRVTAIGRILRKLSLDEVPQLLNVLRGDMSIVGPRPPLRYEVDNYEPWQLARLSVRPGITGLWQISGRNRLSFAEMCELDIEYIKGWRLRRDLSIMARTPWVMLVDAGGAE
jgi:lipopolysaccharide/colanic/teichoic acid biosynthesis glycosyltransferase